MYVLKKLLNFANEKKAKVKKDTNKIDKFEYFKKNLIVFESTFLISVEVYWFIKHDIHERFFINTAIAHDIVHEKIYYFSIV